MAKKKSVVESWRRIERVFSSSKTDHMDSLEKPATSESILKLEKTLDISLPNDFRQSLVIHDGQKSGVEIGAFPGFYNDDIGGSYYLMYVRSIVRHWRDLRAVKKAGDFDDADAVPDRGVSQSWWNERWIPFSTNGGGDYFCIDLFPAAGGVDGQIVSVEGNAGPRRLIAQSYSEWLASCAEVIGDGDLPE